MRVFRLTPDDWLQINERIYLRVVRRRGRDVGLGVVAPPGTKIERHTTLPLRLYPREETADREQGTDPPKAA